LLPCHQTFADRFVAACQADSRVVAALLVGSYAKGLADTYSDLDVCVVTTDSAFEAFKTERETFLGQLGDLVFLEDFEIPNIAFYIFADGVEGELYFWRAGGIKELPNAPYQVLLDKIGLLAETVSPNAQPTPENQTETLRRQLHFFWHEMSHFITALGRGQLWWAYGQLGALRNVCLNLARLHHNFADGEIGDEPYFKIEKAMPIERIVGLQDSICLMERAAMLQSAWVILRFYQTLAADLTQKHGLEYPAKLENVMIRRLNLL
jgi:predicted nucleotidyltransferase